MITPARHLYAVSTSPRHARRSRTVAVPVSHLRFALVASALIATVIVWLVLNGHAV